MEGWSHKRRSWFVDTKGDNSESSFSEIEWEKGSCRHCWRRRRKLGLEMWTVSRSVYQIRTTK